MGAVSALTEAELDALAAAHYTAWSFNAAEREGWADMQAHNLGMTLAVWEAAAPIVDRIVAERVEAERAEDRARRRCTCRPPW